MRGQFHDEMIYFFHSFLKIESDELSRITRGISFHTFAAVSFRYRFANGSLSDWRASLRVTHLHIQTPHNNSVPMLRVSTSQKHAENLVGHCLGFLSHFSIKLNSLMLL